MAEAHLLRRWLSERARRVVTGGRAGHTPFYAVSTAPSLRPPDSATCLYHRCIGGMFIRSMQWTARHPRVPPKKTATRPAPRPATSQNFDFFDNLENALQKVVDTAPSEKSATKSEHAAAIATPRPGTEASVAKITSTLLQMSNLDKSSAVKAVRRGQETYSPTDTRPQDEKDWRFLPAKRAKTADPRKLVRWMKHSELSISWMYFHELKTRGQAAALTPTAYSRLLMKILHYRFTDDRSASQALPNQNAYLQTLLSTMRAEKGSFARPRDYAFWMDWMMRHPSIKSVEPTVGEYHQVSRDALDIYDQARSEQRADDPRVLFAAANAVMHLVQKTEAGDYGCDVKRLIEVCNEVANAATRPQLTAYVHLLISGYDWMPSVLAYRLWQGAQESAAQHRAPSTQQARLDKRCVSSATQDPLLAKINEQAMRLLSRQSHGHPMLAVRLHTALRSSGHQTTTTTWNQLIVKLVFARHSLQACRLWQERCDDRLPLPIDAGVILIWLLARKRRYTDATAVYQSLLRQAVGAHPGDNPLWPVHRAYCTALLATKQLTEAEHVLSQWTCDTYRSNKWSKARHPSAQWALANAHARLMLGYAGIDRMDAADRVYRQAITVLDPTYTHGRLLTAAMRVDLLRNDPQAVVARWAASDGIPGASDHDDTFFLRCATVMQAFRRLRQPEEAVRVLHLYEASPLGRARCRRHRAVNAQIRSMNRLHETVRPLSRKPRHLATPSAVREDGDDTATTTTTTTHSPLSYRRFGRRRCRRRL